MLNGQLTDYGLEARKDSPSPEKDGATPSYPIEAHRLLEITKREAHEYYDWPVHMAEKSWVDIDVFIEAFLVALIAHRSDMRER